MLDDHSIKLTFLDMLCGDVIKYLQQGKRSFAFNLTKRKSSNSKFSRLP